MDSTFPVLNCRGVSADQLGDVLLEEMELQSALLQALAELPPANRAKIASPPSTSARVRPASIVGALSHNSEA